MRAGSPGIRCGTLPQAEATLVADAGPQTRSALRADDYGMMRIDPVDDCTFWFTQGYVDTTGSATRQTRIGAFRFPSCAAAPGKAAGALSSRDSGTGAITVNGPARGRMSVGALAPTGVTLAWDPNTEPDVAGYEVSYGTQSGVYSTTVDVGSVTSAPLTLTSDSLYYFAVRAYTSSSPRLYSPYSTEVSYNATKTAPVITWATPAAIVYGTALGAVQLNATANVPGTFAYAPAGGTVLNAGAGQTLSVTFTPTDGATYSVGTRIVVIDVTKAAPVITWAAPSSIVQGTALGATQLNATATVPGTFAYTPASGTVLSAGTGQILSAAFTPTDQANYTIATATVTIDVTPALPRVTSIAVDRVFPFAANGGTSITWTASATGGAAPLQYRFVRWQQSTNTMTIVQALGAGSSYIWTPAAGDAGFYQIGVYVRDSECHWASMFTALIQITGQPLTLSSLVANQAFPFTADGTASITWTATATGGSTPLQYRFVRWQQATNTTTTVQALGSSNTYSWTPTPGDAGHYQIGVYVRDADCHWVSLFTSLFQVTGQSLTITALSTNQAFPFAASGASPITWTATASGGAAPLQYRFVRYQQSTSTTTIVQALGASNAYSWTPGPGDAGLYQIGVYVRDNVGVWRSSFTSIFQIK